MSNCNNQSNMPIQLAPLFGAGLGALQQSKLQKAAEGIKTYTKPKTIFGKLIGGVSGRTAAAEQTDMYKSQPLSQKQSNALSTKGNVTPITGGFSFGGEAGKKTFLPFAIVAAVVAVFYFMRGKKGGRRRY